MSRSLFRCRIQPSHWPPVILSGGQWPNSLCENEQSVLSPMRRRRAQGKLWGIVINTGPLPLLVALWFQRLDGPRAVEVDVVCVVRLQDAQCALARPRLGRIDGDHTLALAKRMLVDDCLLVLGRMNVEQARQVRERVE